jgi:methanogenic corrinoid protein MtbC1
MNFTPPLLQIELLQSHNSSDQTLKALETLTDSIREVGDAFGAGECFFPGLVGTVEAMQNAMPILEEKIEKRGEKRERARMLVAGTIFGEIYNISKTILCALLTADGFDVTDIGIDYVHTYLSVKE